MRISALRVFGVFLLCCLFLYACSDSSEDSPWQGDADEPELELELEVELEQEQEITPVNIDAATKGFQLYYKERVERAVIAYNRYAIFGDVGLGTNIGKAGIKKSGQDIEVVAGPNDNNMIGYNTWHAYMAYRVFGSRILELTLLRMLEGLSFQEGVSGHPGLTNRMALTGWTLQIDGLNGSSTRTRDGAEVQSPYSIESALETEIIHAFFDQFRFTYRLNPADFMFDYMPGVEVGPYAVTYSFSMLPDYIRVSDCCATMMRTPEGYEWEGAFWSNHNSRDNFPDLGLGYLVALALEQDDSIPEELHVAATQAMQAGQRVGDLVQQYEGKLMTVDEHHPYDSLVVAGALRPDGETEIEDLGSLSDCQTAFLARAISSQGLPLPVPELPLPGSIEFLLEGLIDECHAPEGVRMCSGLGDAFCEGTWGEAENMHFFGHPWLEFAREIEEDSPGSAQTLIGSFQDDYYEKTLAVVAIVVYAETVGDEALLEEARGVLLDMTKLMRTFADIIYEKTQPDRWVNRRYEAALFDGYGGLEVPVEDLNDFARAESHMARLESLLTLTDTEPAALLTDEEIFAQAEERLAGRSETVKQRYEDHYGSTPPIRRTDDGYEARRYESEALTDWQPVSRPQHQIVGGFKLMEAISLCITAPERLDCTWAKLGCARPDLNADRKVDESDQQQFDSLFQNYQGQACDDGNQFCEGVDLDQSGLADEYDQAFMLAAQGCWYE